MGKLSAIKTAAIMATIGWLCDWLFDHEPQCTHLKRRTVVASAAATCETLQEVCDHCGVVLKTNVEC